MREKTKFSNLRVSKKYTNLGTLQDKISRIKQDSAAEVCSLTHVSMLFPEDEKLIKHASCLLQTAGIQQPVAQRYRVELWDYKYSVQQHKPFEVIVSSSLRPG